MGEGLGGRGVVPDCGGGRAALREEAGQAGVESSRRVAARRRCGDWG